MIVSLRRRCVAADVQPLRWHTTESDGRAFTVVVSFFNASIYSFSHGLNLVAPVPSKPLQVRHSAPDIQFGLRLAVDFGVLKRRLRAVLELRPPFSLKIENSYVPAFRRPENEQADLLVGGVVGSRAAWETSRILHAGMEQPRSAGLD
jgi:hypothetical protein